MSINEKGALRRWLGRVVLAVFLSLVLGTVGLTVQQVHASGGTCLEDACKAGSDNFCEDLGCDFCDRSSPNNEDWECKDDGIG